MSTSQRKKQSRPNPKRALKSSDRQFIPRVGDTLVEVYNTSKKFEFDRYFRDPGAARKFIEMQVQCGRLCREYTFHGWKLGCEIGAWYE